jgi:8-oxo-dGTP pyrophosphatase MutT (NUDIX family)
MESSAGIDKRAAAVVLPIFDEAPFNVLFVERASHLRRHAGQIAFPGGAVDAGDADHTAAALRELHEEVGIPPEAVTIVEELPEVRQERNVFKVTPFVGIVRAGTPLVVDLNEAAGVHVVPLDEILRPGAIRLGPHEVGAGRTVEVFIFDYGTLHVWGLTGRILQSFVELYGREGSALRDTLDALRSGDG